MVDLLKTYVEGFDDAIGGGVPAGSVVLVKGEPGTMKSSFVYNILHKNASKEGLSCLYITLEQRRRSLESQMIAMGFPLEDAFEKLTIMDVSGLRKKMVTSSTDKVWLDFLKKCVGIRREIRFLDIVAIDSLDALEALSRYADRRIVIYELFEWLRDCEFTTFLIAEEAPELVIKNQEIVVEKNDAEYLADAVIHLKMMKMDDQAVRRLIRCIKMRKLKHETAYFAMMFEDGTFKVARAV